MGDTRVNESLQRGIESAKTGNKLLARLHLLQAVELAPHDPNCWLWLAWVAESPASAVHSLKRVLDDDPDHELAQIGMQWASALANFEYQTDNTEIAAIAPVESDEADEEPRTEPAAGEVDDEEYEFSEEDTTGSASRDEPEAAWDVLEEIDDVEAAESADEEEFPEDAADSAWAADAWENASAQEESPEDLDDGESEIDWESDAAATAPTDYTEDSRDDTQDFDEEDARESDPADGEALEAIEPESSEQEFEDDPMSSEIEIEADADYQEDLEDLAEPAAIDEESSAPDTSEMPADQQADIWWQMEDDGEPASSAAEDTHTSREESDFAETDNEEAAESEAVSELVEEPAETESVDDVAVTEQLKPVLASKNELETVEFELPLQETLLDEEGLGEEAPPAGEDGVAVLVVDDSPTVRKLVAMTLEKHGFSVESAPDGVVALKTIAEVKPRLILLDITMPRLGGYQLCKLIKKHESTKHIPVIMLSGKDGMFDKVRGKFVGCDDYITKPFDPDLLVEKVTTQLTEHDGVAAT